MHGRSGRHSAPAAAAVSPEFAGAFPPSEPPRPRVVAPMRPSPAYGSMTVWIPHASVFLAKHVLAGSIRQDRMTAAANPRGFFEGAGAVRHPACPILPPGFTLTSRRSAPFLFV